MPQMPPMEDDAAIEAFLQEEAIAVLSTHNADGTIHSAPILFLFADGVFHLGTQTGAQRVINLQRDPRATLLIERRKDPFKYVIAYGTAQVVDTDFERRVEILSRLYSEEGSRAFAGQMRDEFGLVSIEFRAERMVTVDYSRGGAG
ncbi:MAG: pyridoxamine 5'-phosphate oxidase family protein [Acidimicrobiia bacterium]|nr:pyridoxamine 5'-phosphate oxidase family protein [Acidimicrobiia bacterium]